MMGVSRQDNQRAEVKIFCMTYSSHSRDEALRSRAEVASRVSGADIFLSPKREVKWAKDEIA
jgi:hypothetical protein